MFKEFKAFILRGNVMDMAVGIIIGAAFSKIVSSFVSDVMMPPIGFLLGKVDFSNLFMNAVIDFLIVAVVIFALLQLLARMRKKDPAPTTKDCPLCSMSIPLAAKKCGHCTSSLVTVAA